MQKHRSPSRLSCTPHPQHLLPEKTEQKLPRTCAFKAKRHKHHAVLPASCYQSHRPPPPATHRGFATSLQGRAAWQVNKGKHRAAGMKYKSSAICLHFMFRASIQDGCYVLEQQLPSQQPHTRTQQPRSILTPPATAQLSAVPPPPPKYSQPHLALCLPSCLPSLPHDTKGRV